MLKRNLSSVRAISILNSKQLHLELLAQVAAQAFPGAAIALHRNIADSRSLSDQPAVDLLIADVFLNDGNMLDLLTSSRWSSGQAPSVIIVTAEKQPWVLLALKSLGVHAVFDSEAEGPGALAEMLRRAGSGRARWSCTLAMQLSRSDTGANFVRGQLTATEQYMLAISGDGAGTKVVADRFGLTASAVSDAHKRLRAKLRVQNQSELVLSAIRNGFTRIMPDGSVERPGVSLLRTAYEAQSRRCGGLMARALGSEGIVPRTESARVPC